MEEEKRIVINTCKSLQPGSHQQTVPTHSEAIVIGGKGYNTWLLFTRPNRAFSSNRFRNVIVFHFFFCILCDKSLTMVCCVDVEETM